MPKLMKLHALTVSAHKSDGTGLENGIGRVARKGDCSKYVSLSTLHEYRPGKRSWLDECAI